MRKTQKNEAKQKTKLKTKTKTNIFKASRTKRMYPRASVFAKQLNHLTVTKI